MQISVTCRHMEVTAPLRDHAHSKVEHDFADYPRVTSVHVILDVQKRNHIAEIVVHAKNHIHVEATESSDDMYFSIDKAVEKASKQLRKMRDKVQDHRSGERVSEASPEPTFSEYEEGA